MNTGQMMLVIAAFAMLSTLALSINGMITSTLILSFESELAMNAHAVAQSLLDEILTKEFDEKVTDGKKVYKFSDMTPTSGFGPDAGESLPGGITSFDTELISGNFQSRLLFDDVDDYHNYKRRVKNLVGWQFEATITIQYVNENDPNTLSSSQTYNKRIIVSVTNPNLAKNATGQVIPITMRDLGIYRRYF